MEFSAKDICDIIKTGSKSGMSLLKLGAIEVEYLPSVGPSSRESNLDGPEFDLAVPESIDNPQVEMSDPSLMEQVRVQQLMAEDPIGYETEMIDSLLERERTQDARIQN